MSNKENYSHFEYQKNIESRELADFLVKMFSYDGEHLSEGRIMFGGGFNAPEWVDGSFLVTLRKDFYQKTISEIEERYILDKDPSQIEKYTQSLILQFPYLENLPKDKHDSTIRDVVALLNFNVNYHFIDSSKKELIIINQPYIGLISPLHEELISNSLMSYRESLRPEIGMRSVVIGDRTDLYNKYRELTGTDFPR